MVNFSSKSCSHMTHDSVFQQYTNTTITITTTITTTTNTASNNNNNNNLVISSTGVIPKSPSQSLKRLNLHPNTYIQMQKSVILGTCSIVRNFLNYKYDQRA
jgi:hypothetical protein